MSLQADIDRGLQIVEEIAALEKELKEIKARVDKAAVNGPQVALEDAARDGTQYLAKGSEKIVPVIITADFLVASFGEDSKKHHEIAGTLAEPLLLHDFYERKVTFQRREEDGKTFRKVAREMIGGPEAERFIQACVARDKEGIARSAVKIAWDRARPIGEEVSRG